jgi:hypothetical protein
MKKLYSKIVQLLFFGVFMPISSLFAGDPPPPTRDNNQGFDGDVVVGGAIDNFIPLLFLVAMILGIWIINKYKPQQS